MSITITTALRLCAFGISLCLLLSPLMMVSAQDGEPAQLNRETQCSLGGIALAPTLALRDYTPLTLATSTHTFTVTVQNPTEHVLPEVMLSIGLYSEESARVPTLFTTSPKVYDLGPGELIEDEVSVGFGSVPPGEYELRITAYQGAATEALRANMLNEVVVSRAVVVQSVPIQPVNAELTFTGDAALAGGVWTVPFASYVDASVVTENAATVGTLPATELALVITSQQAPVGPAVAYSDSDSLMLIPGRQRESTFSTNLITDDAYYVYAFYTQSARLLPVIATRLNYLNERGDIPSLDLVYTPYLSYLGVAEGGRSATVCVNYFSGFGEEEEPTYSEPTREIRVSQQMNESLRSGTTSLSIAPSDPLLRAVTVPLSIEASSSVTAAITQNTFGPQMSVQTLSVDYSCEEYEQCLVPRPVTSAFFAPFSGGQPISLYLGVVAAAALLGYLMIRRLPTSNPPTEQDIEGVTYKLPNQ